MTNNQYGIRIIEKNINLENVNGVFPQVSLNNNRIRENKINSLISNSVNSLIKYEANDIGKVSIDYFIKLNRKGLLSVLIEAYSPEEERSQFSSVKAITIDIRTAAALYFDDLFEENSYYELIINKMINDDIEANDTPLIQEFRNINQNKEFYLTEDSLVSWIPLYKDTCYASFYCSPEFSIPLKKIKGLLNSKSPVKRLLYLKRTANIN